MCLQKPSTDFGSTIKDSLPYLIQSPDEFFVFIDDIAPEAVRTVTGVQSAYWIQRRGAANLVEHLRDADCQRFAMRIAVST